MNRESRSIRVMKLTASKLEWLLRAAPEGVCKATLAQLRRGVGRTPGELPELWGLLLRDIPEDMQGKGMQPSREELAVYTALTLFAVHQQGWDPRTQAMYRLDAPLGSAVAALIPAGDDNARERVERRFSRAATSINLEELAFHLRGLVQMIGAVGIPLDWSRLAAQFYDYQFPERTSGVRLRWGEDFYSVLNRRQSDPKEEDERS